MASAFLILALSQDLKHAPAPPDNPLKGFVPYTGVHPGFPHSMEWFHIPLAEVMTGTDTFDWKPLERRLDEIAGRGHQAIFRVTLDYPGQPSGVPEYLKRAGLKIRSWENSNADSKTSHTPDYEDPRLREALRRFIAAFGERYDADARIAYLSAGLLGTWGEWHEYPHSEWFASKAVQREVLDAYAAAFKTTPVLLRYPAGPDDASQAANADRPFGYHDDSFCWATRATARKEDDWFFLPALRRAGALEKWRQRPIGGEVRPEVWATLWNEPTGAPRGQEYGPCVEETHASWLLYHGLFRRPPKGEALDRALAGARKLGYELHVTRVEIQPRRVSLQVKNLGVAPFTLPWKIEVAAASKDAAPAAVWPVEGRLSDVQPGKPASEWTANLDGGRPPAGTYALLLRIVNPLASGRPVRFANETQDADRPGWLTLGSLIVN